MEQERLGNLLRKLGEHTNEPAGNYLANRIKNQIPENPALHKSSLHNVRIIIDLRVNKLTAAAAIIFTLAICLAIFGSRSTTGNDFIQNIRGIVLYFFQADNKDAQLAEIVKKAGRNDSASLQIKEIVYYGDFNGSAGSDTLLMHWKLDDGKYRVVFSDFRTVLVDENELIDLQAKMLKRLAVK